MTVGTSFRSKKRMSCGWASLLQEWMGTILWLLHCGYLRLNNVKRKSETVHQSFRCTSPGSKTKGSRYLYTSKPNWWFNALSKEHQQDGSNSLWNQHSRQLLCLASRCQEYKTIAGQRLLYRVFDDVRLSIISASAIKRRVEDMDANVPVIVIRIDDSVPELALSFRRGQVDKC